VRDRSAVGRGFGALEQDGDRMIGQELELQIRERAYSIWEREGRPQGRDTDHWLMASAELAPKVPVRRGRAKAADAAPAASVKAPRKAVAADTNAETTPAERRSRTPKS
jgi:hypothetical protein